jgi:hypothetical protein
MTLEEFLEAVQAQALGYLEEVWVLVDCVHGGLVLELVFGGRRQMFVGFRIPCCSTV